MQTTTSLKPTPMTSSWPDMCPAPTQGPQPQSCEDELKCQIADITITRHRRRKGSVSSFCLAGPPAEGTDQCVDPPIPPPYSGSTLKHWLGPNCPTGSQPSKQVRNPGGGRKASLSSFSKTLAIGRRQSPHFCCCPVRLS